MAATFAALSKNTPTRPSAVSLPSRFTPIFEFCFCNHSIAFSMSPADSSRACLHSPIGWSVRSRSVFTICGVTAAISLLLEFSVVSSQFQ